MTCPLEKNCALAAPHVGQHHSSGSSMKAVPAAAPCDGSPALAVYSYEQLLHSKPSAPTTWRSAQRRVAHALSASLSATHAGLIDWPRRGAARARERARWPRRTHHEALVGLLLGRVVLAQQLLGAQRAAGLGREGTPHTHSGARARVSLRAWRVTRGPCGARSGGWQRRRAALHQPLVAAACARARVRAPYSTLRPFGAPSGQLPPPLPPPFPRARVRARTPCGWLA